MIFIKDKEVQKLLGAKGNYVRLADFAGSTGYKLEQISPSDMNAKPHGL